jgi:Na+-transporting methylmalonyl-CoA/oxaloacetate decarboxylase gamma subunit
LTTARRLRAGQPMMRPTSDAVGRSRTEGGAAVVLDLVLIGLAIALDPLPLTAFLVVLPSQRGVRKGAAFVFGWLVSLAIVVTVTVLATGNSPPQPNTAPSLAELAAKIALGTVLIVIAIRHHRRTRQPRPKKPPKWQAHVDSMSPWFAMGLAPALQPWVLIGAGAATVVEAKLSSWPSFLALFGYCVLASSSYLAMEIYVGLRPDQSQAFLARARTWIDTHTDQAITWGSLIVGLWLVAKSIYLIVT